MKIRKLAIVCLVAIFVVYCGMVVSASVNTVANTKENVSLGLVSSSKNSAAKPGPIPLGDPINDPRPH